MNNTNEPKKVLKKTTRRSEKEFDLHSFSTEDICRIIDACDKSRISEFSFKDLCMSFHASKSEVSDQTYNSAEIEFPVTPDDIGNQISPASKEIIDGFYETQQIIDDPSEFEQGVIDSMINGNQPYNEEADD